MDKCFAYNSKDCISKHTYHIQFSTTSVLCKFFHQPQIFLSFLSVEMMSQTALLEALKDLSTYTAISFTLDDYYCAEDSINTAKYFAKRGIYLLYRSYFSF
jgi:hypothetical protein